MTGLIASYAIKSLRDVDKAQERVIWVKVQGQEYQLHAPKYVLVSMGQN